MVESDKHRKMRKEVEKRLEEKGVDFISSHSPGSKGVGPAFYLGDPVEEKCSRSELQISQPDILVERDEGMVSVIEIEKEAKTLEYILGDLYTFLHSECYSDGRGRMIALDQVEGVYILVAESMIGVGSKSMQYEKLIESCEEESGEVEFKIFWKEEIVRAAGGLLILDY